MTKILTPIFALLLFIAGCANAPIGPTSGIAQGTVKGSVNEVNDRAQKVLQQMNVQITGSSIKQSGNERQITGKIGDNEVTVTMDVAPNSTTNVEVKASKNLVSGNKDLAKDILSKIVQQG